VTGTGEFGHEVATAGLGGGGGADDGHQDRGAVAASHEPTVDGWHCHDESTGAINYMKDRVMCVKGTLEIDATLTIT
jgi:hypothetical protein